MAISIADLLKYTELSTAGYIDLTGAADFSAQELQTRALLQERMSESLGQQFFTTDGWQVLGDPRHPPGTAGSHNDTSGFAATLFGRPETAANPAEKVLSIRGTEGSLDNPSQALKDLQVDLGEIGLLGIAISQTVSLFNLVQRMRAEPGQTGVMQLTLRRRVGIPPFGRRFVSVALPAGGPLLRKYYWLESNNNGVGVGGINDGDTITVVGHSLGGHLAAIAHRLFPDLFPQAVVFNSARYDPPTSAKLTRQFLELFEPFGATPSPDFKNVVMYDSEDQAPSDDTSFVSSLISGKLYGPLTNVITEANSHVIEPFMDSLALHALAVSMNPNLSLSDTGALLQAISNTEPDSDERLLRALYRLVKGTEISPPLTIFQAGLASAGDIAARQVFYNSLIELQALVTSKPNARLETLVGTDAFTLEAQAYADVGYRYALKSLDPFRTTGEASIYAQHNQQGELNVYDPATGSGTLTSQWIADRSGFLAWKIGNNTGDRLFGINTTSDANIWYRDEGLNESVYVVSSGLQGSFRLLKSASTVEAFLTQKVDTQRIFFGSDSVEDALNGAAKSDFLYGGGGADRLTGLTGDDYLQGDAGEDVLNGGTGGDVLVGGKDTDKLDGGLGSDTYIWNKGDGFDTITDASEPDGLKAGTIQFRSQSLAGTKTQLQPDNPRLFTDERGILYALTGTPGVDGMLTVVKPLEDGGLHLAGHVPTMKEMDFILCRKAA